MYTLTTHNVYTPTHSPPHSPPQALPASPTGSGSSSLSGFEGVAHQLEAFHHEIQQLQTALQQREESAAAQLQEAQVCWVGVGGVLVGWTWLCCICCVYL